MTQRVFLDGVGVQQLDWGDHRIRIEAGSQRIEVTDEEFRALARIFRELEAQAKYEGRTL